MRKPIIVRNLQGRKNNSGKILHAQTVIRSLRNDLRGESLTHPSEPIYEELRRRSAENDLADWEAKLKKLSTRTFIKTINKDLLCLNEYTKLKNGVCHE